MMESQSDFRQQFLQPFQHQTQQIFPQVQIPNLPHSQLQVNSNFSQQLPASHAPTAPELQYSTHPIQFTTGQPTNPPYQVRPAQQQVPAIYALNRELYNVNDALTVLYSVANVQSPVPDNRVFVPVPGQPDFSSYYPVIPCINNPLPPPAPSAPGLPAPAPARSDPSAMGGNSSSSLADRQPASTDVKPDYAASNNGNLGTGNSRDNQASAASESGDPALSAYASQKDSVESTVRSEFMYAENIPEFAATSLVKTGMVSLATISTLVEYFFEKIEPFFPFIHQTFRNYVTLAQHEVLLATIAAIPCKYSTSPMVRELSQALWSKARQLIYEASHTACICVSEDEDHRRKEAIAVAFSLLLNQEWPLDYKITMDQYNQGGQVQIANACSLAKVTRVLEENKHLFIGLHMLDSVVACRVGVRSNLGTPKPTPSILSNLTIEEKARMNTTKLLCLASKTLFPDRDTTRELVTNGSFLPLLDIIHPHFERWIEDYHSISRNTNWDARNVLFEFNHCRLYVYSLAISSQQTDAESRKSETELSFETWKYIQIAIEAALFIIDFEVFPENKVSLSGMPPMRWIVRFIHATIFLAKVLMFPPSLFTKERKKAVYASVSKASDAMKQSGAVNFQLMGRYVEMMKQIKDQVSQEFSTIKTEVSSDGNISAAGQTSSDEDAVNSNTLSLSDMGFGKTVENFPNKSVPLSPFSPVSHAPSQTSPDQPLGGYGLDSDTAYWDLLNCTDIIGVDNTMTYMPHFQTTKHLDGDN